MLTTLNIIFDLICIQWLVVFIVDLSGIVDTFKSVLARFLTQGAVDTSNYRLKPFDCSLCSTFWCCLIYLIITGTFSIPLLAFVGILAWTADNTKNILITIRETLIKIF